MRIGGGYPAYAEYETSLDDPDFHVPATRLSLVRSVYLAGKITGDSWRDEIIPDWSQSNHAPFQEIVTGEFDSGWMIARRCVGIPGNQGGPALDYTGPYWVGNGCCGGHCTQTYCAPSHHAMKPRWGRPRYTGQQVAQMAFRAIRRSDLVFCWINSRSCYGTIAEIGYARGLNRIVVVATPKPADSPLWVVLGMAHRVIKADSPRDGWKQLWSGPDIRIDLV